MNGKNTHEKLNERRKSLALKIEQLKVIIDSEKEKIAWTEKKDMREIYKGSVVYYREFQCPICNCGKTVQLADLIKRKQDLKERYNTTVKEMARIRKLMKNKIE